MDMDRVLEAQYAEFYRLLEEEKVYRDRTLCFVDICQKIGTDPIVMNALLLDELGMSGEEVLSRYRNIDY